ncbi:PIR Superfamily Protein, partial [Plasmodium malariae]
MSGVLQESFIKSLPSNRYYRTNFELEADYCYHFENNNGFEEARSKLINHENVKSIQNKLTKALCSVAFINEGVVCTEKCRNLYYWLGNELLLNKIEENVFLEVIGMLIEFSNALYERYKCKCIFFTDVNKEKFEKMKIVYDYCIDYDNIKGTLEGHNNKCTKEFNDYLLKANSAYNEIYNCTKNNPEMYCMQLKTHVSSCFKKKLSPLTCKIEEVSAQEKGLSQYDTNHFDPTYVINASNFSSSQIFLFFVLPFIGIFFIGFLLYK